MCGIAGFSLRHENANPAVIRSMCDQIRHRGPDDEGFHLDGGCAIGMRRLSIIDLSTGHQPISNEDGTIWVVFNGEIYNYRQLRQNLIDKGHRFATHSDTETLIHLYEERGTEGLAGLRGMFAFAIWDSRRQRLLLVRDRFGKKPLYYAVLPEGIYFGSELKCLRAAGGIPFELDEEALRLYFKFLYIPDPYTPFRCVRKLPAASWLIYNADGAVQQGQYWKLPGPAESALKITEEEVSQRVREAFDESVRIRMIADVPLGAFLSGGIDSSSVVASMALQSPEPIKTFSIGFEESDFNELPYARLVAQQYRTEHHEIIVKPDSISLIQRLIRHFDEPFGDSSAIPTFIVSEFAVQHVKVALSGDGGDELFAGYDSFLEADRLRKLDLVPQFVRRGISAIADKLPYSAYGKNYLRMISRPSALDRYFSGVGLSYFVRQQMLQPEWMLPDGNAFLAQTLPGCLLPNGADILSQALYFEATAKLAGDMLTKVDRMSMANSLEVRCPLLDHKLAELAADIPPDMKIRGGKGKFILVEAMKDRLPKALLSRGKMGFGVPLAQWFRTSLKAFLWDHLTDTVFLNRGIVSPPFVRALLAEHDSGRRNHYHLLWSLLMLELWFREWTPVMLPAAKEAVDGVSLR